MADAQIQAIIIREATPTPAVMRRYDDIPIAFTVESVLEPVEVEGGVGGLRLVERPIAEPYLKDYDTYEGQGPSRWHERFDMSRWGVLFACAGPEEVGAALIAYDTPGVNLLEGRRDLAILWDLRVRPEYRSQGVGKALFDAAAAWCRRRNCVHMKIETQNVNVPACRFYAAQGCHLGTIDRYGYAGDAHTGHEVMLLWYLTL
jgi:streptothricin acetyltransferase